MLHAFLCYTDGLKVYGWRVDKERFYKRAIYNILLLSLIPTYKDEPSAHGRCELEARRSVHPERMQVGALTSIWQVGVPPAEAQGGGFCE